MEESLQMCGKDTAKPAGLGEREKEKYRATYCARNYPLPLLPSGPGGVGGITSRRTRHSLILPLPACALNQSCASDQPGSYHTEHRSAAALTIESLSLQLNAFSNSGMLLSGPSTRKCPGG